VSCLLAGYDISNFLFLRVFVLRHVDLAIIKDVP
jgi:hypothetical protein